MNYSNVAEVEISYKRNTKNKTRLKIQTSTEAYNILIGHWDQNKIELLEQAKILLLDKSLKVLGISEISSGGVSGTVVDPKIAFVTALKANASHIILAHNHPSGNLAPSDADFKITNKIKEAGKLLDIEMSDHLIVSNDGFYSFSDRLTYEKVTRNNIVGLEALLPF